jgi:hypothetical protein
LILYHLAAITIAVLDAPSGPWPTPNGRGMGDGPPFARAVRDVTTVHGKYLRVAHSFRLVSNRPGDVPAVRFEAHLKDADGKPLETLSFPDANANPWLRHRQGLLASALAPDLPVETPGGEVIAAPGQKVPTFSIWTLPGDVPGEPAEPAGDRKLTLRLRTVPQHLVPRNRPVMRPSDWGILLARSYARFLCRTRGAASAEIVRVTRDSVSPDLMFPNAPPGASIEDLDATFGEIKP